MRSMTLLGLVMALAMTAAACSKERSDAAPPSGHVTATQPVPAKQADAAGAPASAPPHEDEAEQHEALPTKVRLPASVVRSAGIKLAASTSDSLPSTVDLPGEIAADPDKSARLAARVPGRIVDVRVKEGGRVTAGQTVAVLESPELARARATLASAGARARSARLNADRLKSLEAKSLASGQEVSAAQAEAAALDAEAAAARQTLGALGQGADEAQGGSARVTIRSPLTGFVLSRDAVQGQTVDAAHVIAVVGDLDNVYFLGR
ncbi:MAG: rane fusion protein heavy metal efflux system, partial [Chloroflexota bacterium]|nr:rane fusion protein heavy metal efflux system [Chloroflexota bacterium]